MDLTHLINAAREEAIKQAIEANAILINKSLMKTDRILCNIFNSEYIIPPMVLGMRCAIIDGLPDDVAFAITAVDEEKLRTEAEKRIRMEVAKEMLQAITECRTVLSDVRGKRYNRYELDQKDIENIADRFGVEVDDE